MGGFITGFTKGLGDAAMQRARQIRDDQEKEKDAQAKSRWDQFNAWLKVGGHLPEEIDRARNSVIADVQKIYGNSKPLKEIFQKFGQVLESVHKRAAGGAGTGASAPGGTPAAGASPGTGRSPVQAGPSAGLPPPPAGTGAGAASATPAATAGTAGATPTAGATAKPTGLTPPPPATVGAAPSAAAAPAAAPAKMPAPPASEFAQEAATANLSPLQEAQQDAQVASVKSDAEVADRRKQVIAQGGDPHSAEGQEYILTNKITPQDKYKIMPDANGNLVAIDPANPAIAHPVMTEDGKRATGKSTAPKVLSNGSGPPYAIQDATGIHLPSDSDFPPHYAQILAAATDSYHSKLADANDRLDTYMRAYTYMRGQVYFQTVRDTITGDITTVNANQLNQLNAANPGRYVVSSQATPLFNRQAVFNEIDLSSSMAKQAIDGLGDESFTAEQRAKIAGALRATDPHSAMEQFIGSEFASALTPAQMNYVTALENLTESSMALRGVQGLGQGSDLMRNAVIAMIPGPKTPTKAYAQRQMMLFDQTWSQLQTAVPGNIQRALPSPTKPSKKLPAPPPKSSSTSKAAQDYMKGAGIPY